MSVYTITEIRRRGGDFLKSLNTETYQSHIGLKRESNLTDIYRAHPEFLDEEFFHDIRGMSSDELPDASSRMLILDFLARAFLGAKTASIWDKIQNRERAEDLTVNRKTVAYRSAGAEIKIELKRANREKIEYARSAAASKLAPLYGDLINTLHASAESLGFANLTALSDEVQALTLEPILKRARQFLNDTEYVYRDLLGWFFLRRMDMKLRDVKRHDLDFLLNAFELRGNFPKTDLMKLAKAAFAETGLSIGGDIKPDIIARKGKVSDAIGIAPDPPRTVCFSIYPVGGIEDFDSFFRGIGGSLFYAGGDIGDNFEFRCLREEASVELFGALFANLVYEPRWINRRLRAEVGRDFFQFLCLRRLLRMRLQAGMSLYEAEFWRGGDFREKLDFFKETLKNATLSEHSEADYSAAKPFSPSASRFRAEVAAFEVSESLVSRYDEQWWRAGDAGVFLRRLWQEGGRMTCSEALSRFGRNEADSASALRFFERAFP